MIVQILDIQAVDGFAAEIVEGAHAGDDPVAAGLGQQRAVVADAQIAVAATQVQHPQAAAGGGIFGFGQIVLGGDDGQFGEMGFPVGGVFHQNDVIGHRFKSVLLTP
jgi:hypothetical protein